MASSGDCVRSDKIAAITSKADIPVDGINEDTYHEAKTFVTIMYVFGVLLLPILVGIIFLWWAGEVEKRISKYEFKNNIRK